MTGHPVIVVIEDDPDMAQVFLNTLGGEGFRVVTMPAPPGAGMMDFFNLPDLFVIDVMLGRGPLTGIAIARTFRLKGLSTPMVATSASPDMLTEAKASGVFNAFLDKPFELDALLALCVRLTGPSSAHRSGTA